MVGDDDSSYVSLLRVIRLRELAEERIDIDDLAATLSSTPFVIETEISLLERWGLLYGNRLEELPPFVLGAGLQYIEREGEVENDVLRFLSLAIDDLNAREALLIAGSSLVEQFGEAILVGDGLEYARSIVPDAFVQVVDERLAIKLYAAAIALIARLSAGSPAGCLAEEIVAVALIDEAEAVLTDARDDGEITSEEASDAIRELGQLFEMFGDDDVLALFKMKEPADAALATHDPVKRRLGVTDQRVEAWFNAFGGVAVTGLLR